MHILHSVLVWSVTEADSSHGRSQLKLSPAAVFKLYGDGWPQPSRWRALYHRQIFFTGFGNIFSRIVWGTFISWSQHSFILLKVWRLCQLEQLTWRPPQLHLCWNLILSSAPWELQYNHGDSHGSSRQNRSLDLTDIESGSKCLADFLSFYISFLLGFVKLRSSWIWKIGKWDNNH